VTTSELKSKLEKSVEYLQVELAKVRTGRASPAMVEEIKVNAYEAMMAIRELGSISVPDAQSLVISPWDKGLSDQIAKAIRESDLNLNPMVDGDLIRVPIPDLTEERRKEMTKLVTSKVEEVKNSIRNIRQEAMKDIDKQFDDKDISEDEKFDTKEEVEKIVKEHNDNSEKLGEDKKKDLLSI
jgi:ribosome recycling factor